MTEPSRLRDLDGMSESLDAYDMRLAQQAEGRLRAFNIAGLLEAADVHVAHRLGELGGEPDDRVRLAVALTVRALRQGSVCVDLADIPRIGPELDWPEASAWAAAVAASPLAGPGKPLRWEGGFLYLERYWRQEDQVCTDLMAREARAAPAVDEGRLEESLARLFPGVDAHAQRVAAMAAATRWTTVLGGGPGTGKTTTVARLLAVLLDQPGPPLRTALAAPTGKAAARLQEAVHDVAAVLGSPDRDRLAALTASTLHRLLGSTPGHGTRFRHGRANRLPYDVVVVDETSMVSLTMMARLLEATRPNARLILVGDPDQLASVEAGAVLADLVAGLTGRRATSPEPSGERQHGVVLLRRIWRFGGAIAELAGAVRDGDADAAVAVLTQGADDVSFTDTGVREEVVDTAVSVRAAAEAGDAAGALHALAGHRLLCAHRAGPYGVDRWSREIERWLAAVPDAAEPEEPQPRQWSPRTWAGGASSLAWYIGRPLLVTANDYSLSLFNGDTGVVVRTSDGAMRAAFPRGRAFVTFAPSRLSAVQTVHAMTVHRSQGSQFRRVTMIVPPEDSPLLTRELLYTALTRAQEHVRVVGTEAAFRAAIARPAARASGLRERLASRALEVAG